MKQKKKKFDVKEDIKIDEYENSGSSEKRTTKKFIQDYQKLIISIVLLVVLVIMVALQAYPVAAIIVSIPLAILIYLMNKKE